MCLSTEKGSFRCSWKPARLEPENARLRADLENLRKSVEPQANEDSGTAEAESESEQPLGPDETSEAAGDGCDMKAKEMVDLLRETASND